MVSYRAARTSLPDPHELRSCGEPDGQLPRCRLIGSTTHLDQCGDDSLSRVKAPTALFQPAVADAAYQLILTTQAAAQASIEYEYRRAEYEYDPDTEA